MSQSNIYLNYTKLTYKTKTNKPYLFIGSKIRGTFGYALKEEVCINPSYKCEGCFASTRCVFYEMFEKQNITHPYRLDFKLSNKKIKFSLFLFGSLQEHSKPIHKAMKRSLKEFTDLKTKKATKTFIPKSKPPKLLRITLETPLRIKQNNHLATKDLSIVELCSSIHRRYNALVNEEKKTLFDEPQIISKHLYFQNIKRRSNKQKRMMDFGGLMGEIVIANPSKEVYEMLQIGEVIGAGKSTVFGLGKIKLKEIHV